MKITSIETIQLPGRDRFMWVFVHTDEGITGVGESTDKIELTDAAVHDMCASYLLGKDPTDIESIWNKIYDWANYHGYAATELRALSAIDIALWDILGKKTGMPVYKLMGGKVHDGIRIYNTCKNYGIYRDQDLFVNDADVLAKSLLEDNIYGMKIWPIDPYASRHHGQYISLQDVKKAVEPFRKIRKAVGDKMEIYVEMHSMWNIPMAIRLAKALEEFDIQWYEDPILIDDVNNLAALRRKVNVPILASERLFTRAQYKPLLDSEGADIVMVDLSWTGGFTEGKKVASLADSYRIPITTHNCGGPVLTSVCAHFGVSTINAIVTETVRSYYRTLCAEMVEEMPDIRDGYLYPSEKPGLGITFRKDFLERKDLIRRVTSL